MALLWQRAAQDLPQHSETIPAESNFYPRYGEFSPRYDTMTLEAEQQRSVKKGRNKDYILYILCSQHVKVPTHQQRDQMQQTHAHT